MPVGSTTADQMSDRFRLVPLREERLERQIALAFGFMSFIPILIVVWTMVYRVDLGLTLYLIAASVFVGYFLIARRVIKSVVMVARKASAFAVGAPREKIEIADGSEIGELARSFNRITQDLEQKIDELESSRSVIKRLLSKIGNALVSYEGIDHLLELIVENACLALETDMGNLLLVNGEKQELEVKSVWAADGSTRAGQRMKLGEGMAGWVAKEGSPMRGTCAASAVGMANGEAKDGAVLCIPLTIRDQTLGVFSVFRRDTRRPFTEDDELLLANIGSQIAVAMENYRLNLNIESTYLETVMALALAVEAKEPYTAGHSKRVGFYATKIAEAMELDEEMQKTVRYGGILHDVGKIGIRDNILLKISPLTRDEQESMQKHSLIGEAILKPLQSLNKVAQLVRGHHERYDGTGYPGKLKGEEIPLGARILVVADSYDAMSTDRPYRKRLTLDQIKEEFRQGSGTQFDPRVVEALFGLLDDREWRFTVGKSDSQ